MAKQLARTVHGLRDPESGKVVSFEAGSTPPKWAADLISNPAAWGDDAPAEAAGADEGTADAGVPNKSDNKPEWVAYAVSQGMSEDEAEDLTKEDLVERFGG